MKKILSLVMTIMMASSFLAQDAKAQVQFGIRGGVNLVNMKMNNTQGLLSPENRAGFYIGPTVKFTLPIVGLGVDASALYDQKEAKIAAVGANDDITTKQQSIQIPVNLRYGVGLGSMANIFVFAGPQFGFNVGSDKIITEYSKWSWKTANVSINLGIGCTVLNHLEVKANYNVACGKTAEGEVSQAPAGFDLPDGKYNTWQIGAAYYF